MGISQFIQQYLWLLLAIFMFGMAGAAVFTGKLRGRFGDVSYRDQNPRQFWSSVAVYIGFGILFLILDFFHIHSSASLGH